jgi:hypothetical protein
MKKLLIYQHLGMGDHIVHNGMIRKIAEDYSDYEIYVPSKSHNYNNVKYMFRDNPRIVVIDAINDDGMNNMRFDGGFDEVISSHHWDGGKIYSYSTYYDDSFYLKVGMDPNIKQDYFYIERDMELENKVYDELINSRNISEYTFIHEKGSAICINRNYIDSNLAIVSAEPQYDFFSLLKVIENAKSVNLISSSFLSLFMCKKYNENVIAHMYADRRELSPYIEKHNIKVIL